MAKGIHATNFANAMLDHMNSGSTRGKFHTVEDVVVPVLKANNWQLTSAVLTTGNQIMRKMRDLGLVERMGGKLYKIKHDVSLSGWDRENPLKIGVPVTPEEDDDVVEESPLETETPEVEIEAHKPLEPAKQHFGETEAKEILELRRRVKVLEADRNDMMKDLETKENRIDQIEKLAASANAIKTIRIEKWDGTKAITLKNVILPSYFQMMLDLAQMRRNILLVGPAGCGKTTAAGLLAKAMGMGNKFGKVGGCGGLTESHLLGRYNPLEKEGKKYIPSEFVIRFEQGGVMLIDELDGADQNVLLALNPALDRSGELPLMNRPGKPVAHKHKDFICICTANTFGTGSNRMYAGRNQLDASTLSRFQIGMIEVDYDKNIEKSICQDEELLERIWEIRRKMQESCLRRVIDTRFIEDAWLMKSGKEWNNDKIIGQMLQGWSRDERNKVGEYNNAI